MNRFVAKVCRATASCRKVVLLSAVAASAFGAQAAESEAYTFNLTITSLPTWFDHMTGDSAVYLIDRTNSDAGRVLAYATMGKFDENVSGTDGKKQTSEAESHSGDPSGIAMPKDVTTWDTHTISMGSSILVQNMTGSDLKNVVFDVQFTSSNLNVEDWKETKTGGAGLEAVLVGQVVDRNGGQYDYYQSVDVAKYVYDGGGASFLTEAAYVPVPEPTSAMLLLLGFAGLALKRKQVA